MEPARFGIQSLSEFFGKDTEQCSLREPPTVHSCRATVSLTLSSSSPPPGTGGSYPQPLQVLFLCMAVYDEPLNRKPWQVDGLLAQILFPEYCKIILVQKKVWNLSLFSLPGGKIKNCAEPLQKTVWKFLKKLKIELPYDPEITFLNRYLDKTVIHKDT